MKGLFQPPSPELPGSPLVKSPLSGLSPETSGISSSNPSR